MKRLLVAALLCAIAIRSTADSPTLQQMVVPEIRDFSASVRATQVVPTELEKINRDFATLYRLREITLQYKDPCKLRAENQFGLIIVNGSARHIRFIPLKLKKTDDLGPAVSRRPTLLDVGVITKGTVALVDGKFVKSDRPGDVDLAVFDVTYRGDESIRYRVWFDPAKRFIVRREWYDAAGKLKAVFLGLEPKEVVPGVWLPTRMEVRAADDAVAAVLTYSNVRVNSGLDDSLFAIP